MKFKQAFIAENLLERLNHHYENETANINTSIDGVGVHWHCIVSFQDKICQIHCFEDYNREKTKAEYLIAYKKLKENKAWGRTSKIEEVLTSSATWISNKGVDFLYQL